MCSATAKMIQTSRIENMVYSLDISFNTKKYYEFTNCVSGYFLLIKYLYLKKFFTKKSWLLMQFLTFCKLLQFYPKRIKHASIHVKNSTVLKSKR
jgi:hypothetical protein